MPSGVFSAEPTPDKPVFREVLVIGQAKISLDIHERHKGFATPILRDERDPGRFRGSRITNVDGRPVHENAAAVFLIHSENRPDKLSAPGPDQAGHPKNLAATERQGYVLQLGGGYILHPQRLGLRLAFLD